MAWALLQKQFLAVFIVGLTALLLHVEDDDDTLLVVKQVRLPSPVVKTFKYISHLHNMKFVRVLCSLKIDFDVNSGLLKHY